MMWQDTNVSNDHSASIFRVKIQVEVFWFVTPCSAVLGHQRFGGSHAASTFRMKIPVVFWFVTSCSDVVGHRRFGGPCCPHLHPEDERQRGRRGFGFQPSKYTVQQPIKLRLLFLWRENVELHTCVQIYLVDICQMKLIFSDGQM
jgi:hypothetical protein